MQSTGAGSHLSAALTQSQKCPSSFFSVTESEGLFHHKYSILCDNQGQKEKKNGRRWSGCEFRGKGNKLIFIKYLFRDEQWGGNLYTFYILGKIKYDIGQVTEFLFKKLPVKCGCIKI